MTKTNLQRWPQTKAKLDVHKTRQDKMILRQDKSKATKDKTRLDKRREHKTTQDKTTQKTQTAQDKMEKT
jgi:hypothetical protein